MLPGLRFLQSFDNSCRERQHAADLDLDSLDAICIGSSTASAGAMFSSDMAEKEAGRVPLATKPRLRRLRLQLPSYSIGIAPELALSVTMALQV